MNERLLAGGGEYRLFGEIGLGGMASVRLGRFLGPAGFARTVAVKCPLPALQSSWDFRHNAALEARLAARVSHPHVVSTLDVIESGSELFIVMEYVHGESLSSLAELARKSGERIPIEVSVSLMSGALRGLSAVHQAKDERGHALGLIHRDVSPQNILCGTDGLARLADFGLAKAAAHASVSSPETFKGKLTYASPEQLQLQPLTFASDLYSAGVVLWELLSGQRLYQGLTASELVAQLLHGNVRPPSELASGMPAALDAIVLRALARDPRQRHESALAMALALEAAVRPASVEHTVSWILERASNSLRAREHLLTEAESETTPSQRSPRADNDARAAAQSAPFERDTEPGAASRSARGATPFTAFALRFLAMIAGVGIVWLAAEGVSLRHRSEATHSAKHALNGTEPDASATAPAKNISVAPPPADARASHSAVVGAAPASARPASEPRAPQRVTPERCSPPFSIDADGIRHMKPGCK